MFAKGISCIMLVLIFLTGSFINSVHAFQSDDIDTTISMEDESDLQNFNTEIIYHDDQDSLLWYIFALIIFVFIGFGYAIWGEHKKGQEQKTNKHSDDKQKLKKEIKIDPKKEKIYGEVLELKGDVNKEQIIKNYQRIKYKTETASFTARQFKGNGKLSKQYTDQLKEIEEAFAYFVTVYKIKYKEKKYEKYKKQNAKDDKKEHDTTDKQANDKEEDETKVEPVFTEEMKYADVLDLKGEVTKEAIKKNFKLLVTQYHPDKVSHLGPEFIKMADEKFKNINEAYAYFKDKYDF